MNIKSVAMQAYMNNMDRSSRAIDNRVDNALAKPENARNPFGDTLEASLTKVNDMQTDKKKMIMDFASGKNENLHELMITMQKAGLAMSMTSAVRSKVMSAYQEMMRMSF